MTDTTDQQVEESHRFFIRAARDFYDSGRDNFTPNYDNYGDLLASAEAIASLASVSSASAEGFPNIGADPMKGDRADRIDQSIAACRAAYVQQQKGVPDQTALVWRWHLGALLEYATRLKAMQSRDASPEPVPATNQAGEVAELNQARRRLRFIAERYGPGTSLSIRDTNHLLALLDHVDALATQPATSQEGEIAKIGPRSRLSVIANGGTVDKAYHPSTFSDPVRAFWTDVQALAATPTPPTLSEDLRAEVCRIETRDVHNGYDTQGNYIWEDYISKSEVLAVIDAALAQVKAS